MFNILTYVWVVPATAAVYIILEVPATDKIHIEDWYGLAGLSQNNGIYNTQNSQLMYHYQSNRTFNIPPGNPLSVGIFGKF